MQNMLDDLQDSYFIEGISGKKIPKFSNTTTSLRVKVGELAPKPIINFRSYAKGDNAPTQVQEAGSTFILEMVLRKNKVFNSVADIENDKDTYPVLEKKYFYNYKNNHRIIIDCKIKEKEVVSSLISIFPDVQALITTEAETFFLLIMFR